MAHEDSRSDLLILRRSDMESAPPRPTWVPLFYAFFASMVVAASLALVEWEKIPQAAKRDVGAARACQQHIRSKLPPEPGLEAVDLAIQPLTGLPGPRTVMIAYRAKGPKGRIIEGVERCAFETDADGNFPPFKQLSRTVFRSEGEMQTWKERFLRGEPVAPLEPDRPQCCLPIPAGLTGTMEPFQPGQNLPMTDVHGGRGRD